MESRLVQAKSRAEEQLGFGIPEKVAEAVLRYTERKLFLIRQSEEKDDDYIVILFENELLDHYVRQAINELSSIMQEAKKEAARRYAEQSV